MPKILVFIEFAKIFGHDQKSLANFLKTRGDF